MPEMGLVTVFWPLTMTGVMLKQQFHLSAQGCVISAGAVEIGGALGRRRFLQSVEENLPLALDNWINVCLRGLVHKKKRDRPANPAKFFQENSLAISLRNQVLAKVHSRSALRKGMPRAWAASAMFKPAKYRKLTKS